MRGSKVRRRVVIASIFLVLFTLAINIWDVARYLDASVGIIWAAGVVAFLKTNTQGLLLMAALTLWYEFIGVEKPRADERIERQSLENFFHSVKAHADGRFLVDIGLSRAIPGIQDSRLPELLASPQGFLDSCSLRMSLSKRGDEIEVGHQLDFDWNGKNFIYAIVASAETLAVVNSALPDVLETTVRVDSSEKLADIEARLVAGSPFTFFPGDGSPPYRIELARLSGRESASIHRRLGTTSEKLVMLQSRLREVGVAGRIRVRHSQTHDSSTNYEWWMTDRPTNVKQIFIDASDIGEDRVLSDPIMFVGRTLNSAHRPSKNCWEATNVGWIVAGQGIMVGWKNESA